MRFLQLKNPWSHLRWRGRYSERDDKNWTPELLKYLNFDPKTAQKFDNGNPVFIQISQLEQDFLMKYWPWWWEMCRLSAAHKISSLKMAFISQALYLFRGVLDRVGGSLSVLWCHLPELEPRPLQRFLLYSQVCVHVSFCLKCYHMWAACQTVWFVSGLQ